jgi:hypothetical protein
MCLNTGCELKRNLANQFCSCRPIIPLSQKQRENASIFGGEGEMIHAAGPENRREMPRRPTAKSTHDAGSGTA